MGWETDTGSRRAIALARICVVAAIFLTVRTEGPLDLAEPEFDVAVLVALIYAVAVLAISSWSRWPSWLQPATLAMDYLILGILVFLSGGAFSEVRLAFFVPPAAAAVLRSVRASAAASVAGPLSYTSAAALADPGELSGDLATLLTIDFYLIGFGLAATATSMAFRRRSEELRQSREESRSLATRLLEAEDASRRSLAIELHDHPVQLLGSAQRSLGSALEGDAGAAADVARLLAETERSLRDTMFDLHPYALEELGLEVAIEKMGSKKATRASMSFEFDLSTDTGGSRTLVEEQRVFLIARELVRNAVEHSGGTKITVTLERSQDGVHLSVADDGTGGLGDARRREAVRDGHYGLAGVAERVRDGGGRLEIASSAVGGTTVRVVFTIADAA